MRCARLSGTITRLKMATNEAFEELLFLMAFEAGDAVFDVTD